MAMVHNRIIPWTIIIVLVLGSILGNFKVPGSHLIGLLAYVLFLIFFAIQFLYSFKFLKTSKRVLINRLIIIYSIFYSYTAFIFTTLGFPGGPDLIVLNKNQTLVIIILVLSIILTSKQRSDQLKELKSYIFMASLGILLTLIIYLFVDLETMISEGTKEFID